MDETVIRPEQSGRPDGFRNQRLCVVPRPQIEAALSRAVTRRLLVTDAGYFPTASGHRRVRARGATETIVILCVAGSGTVRLGDEEHPMTPGACVTIPAGVPHDYRASLDDPWTIWWMHVRGTDVPELTGPLLGIPRPLTRLRAVDGAVALFDELVGHLERRVSPAQLLAASGVAWHLLTRLAADSILPAEGSPLERAMRFLETRVDSNIPVAELAGMVGLSSSHLSAMFRRATGGGPGAFHTAVKMARARTLLDTTSSTVTEIAAAVGYSDPLYFSRHFRRVHGMNPTTYRAQHKG
ncbi:helix-turn-helix domain-containing protein [Microbacterium foliorum]|uniref:helix-turn-helix domain-containing protein n=1 Tax=Microbacterium foliorum TaxID=104336 RepID=UPI001DAD95A7|nr:AraC family transcriptional regulator [Microbacterium foliorum]CAH0141669.1 HTH-type transcriptional activator Btr [Microbacterium foliorum]CAH0187234.1 HTH-type transcriptional activator Btr [Microbacterium foliorum]